MRNLFLTAVIAVLFFNSCNQTTKPNTETKDSTATIVELNEVESSSNIDQVIHAFVKAYGNKSNAGVNALVHPDLGLKIIYRPGAADTYTQVDSIDFAKPLPSYFPYPTIISDFSSLNYEAVPPPVITIVLPTKAFSFKAPCTIVLRFFLCQIIDYCL